jgi:hypothetical protein
MNKKNGDTPEDTTTNHNAILQELINASQSTSYSKWLRVVWNNQGILTNQLAEHGLQSNNHHEASQVLNLCIEPLGWKIVKQIKTKPNESWAWFIQRIDKKPAAQLALNLDCEVVL